MIIEKKIVNILKEYKYNFGVTLPCSKINNLSNLLKKEKKIHIVQLTREEEGIGICVGSYLAGKKPFMLIQSSGLGNSFNAIASLLNTYRIPLLILASYRGYYKERISAQIPLGLSLPGMLDAMEIPFIILDKCIDDLELFCQNKFVDKVPHIVLLSPELFENV